MAGAPAPMINFVQIFMLVIPLDLGAVLKKTDFDFGAY
jgi:hypothetical protein